MRFVAYSGNIRSSKRFLYRNYIWRFINTYRIRFIHIIGFELLHSSGCQKHRRVVWDKRGRRHDSMPPRLKKFQKFTANLRYVHNPGLNWAMTKSFQTYHILNNTQNYTTNLFNCFFWLLSTTFKSTLKSLRNKLYVQFTIVN